MVLQAFIDESFDQGENGVFCLGGHIATAESWENFSLEWEALLKPFGILDKSGQYGFKMSDMAKEGRIENVPPFYRVIENNVSCSIACAYKIQDLEKAKKRIFIPNLQVDWGFLDNQYMFAFRLLMDMFHNYRGECKNVIPLNQKVDFYFDNRSEQKQILSTWNQYMKERPNNYKHYFGATPQFRDDKDCLPLQAADLWAWWVRKWTKEGTPEKLDALEFGQWKTNREEHPNIYISVTEDDIVTNIKTMMRPMLEPNRIIYDINFPW